MAALMTVTYGSNAATVGRILDVLFPDCESILDATYGNGAFWKGSTRAVVGLDRDPARAKNVCADFRSLPFADGSFDLVVFDPPYHTHMGKQTPSVMGARFGAFATLAELEFAVRAGAREAARVARRGVLVKVQDHIRSGKLVRMSAWVDAATGLARYDELHLARRGKIVDPKWGTQLSVYRNHATFLAYRHEGPYHRRRRVA